MTDIGIELYEAISADFGKSVEADSVINGIRKRMDNGTASSKDIALYANRLGLWIRTAIERNVSADKLPNGQMYYNIAEKILRPSLQTTNQMFNAVAAEIQKLLDSKQGIRIKPQTVSLPEERIDDVIGAASEPGITEEVMQRRMSVPAETITRSYADDYARANADFRSRAGIDEYIVRRDDGSCCEWCSHLAGRYRYPDEVPKDVYRRHDNCGCIVEHQSGGMRKNVHTKRSSTDEQQREALRELDERKQQQREKIRQAAENAKKPRVLSKAEGSRIEAEVLAKRRERLTGEAESGIIETVSNQQDFMDREHKEQLSRYVYDPKTGGRTLEEWSFRSNPLGEYSNILSQTYSQDARAMAEYLNEKVNNGDYGDLDRIVIAKSKSLKGISSYDYTKNTLYISEELITQEGFDRLVDSTYFPAQNLDDVIIHELDGHKRHWDNVKKFYSDNKDKYPKLEDAKQDYERRLREYVVKEQAYNRFFISDKVSYNSYDDFTNKSSLNELLADCSVHYRANNITDDILFELVKDVMRYDG